MVVYGGPDIVTDGLVLHLDAGNTKSYPGTGSAFFDLINGTNTSLGASTAAPLFDQDGYFNFDGSNDVINGNTPLINRTNGQEITVSCWIKPQRTSGQYSVFCTNRANDTVSFNWIFYQHTNGGEISFHGSSQYKSSYVPVVNKWINVTNTITSGGTSILYVNAVSVHVVNNYTYGAGTTLSRLGIGADPGGQEPFKGGVGPIMIYHTALSPQKIQQNYNALKGRFGL